ncbi:MAG: DNA polymerase III subunit gamma/tau [bacterium]
MATLYRRYRPQKFSEVEGQDHVTKTLQRAAQKDKLTHAYLFYGPRGTGKTTMARLLAKRVNCKKPKRLESCSRCTSCRALMEGRHTDVIEIDAASNRGIDDVRRLRDHINLSPAMGGFRVYIIDEVHMLTREAAAALLKTLEEPVNHAMFVLATTELHKVLPTILSRCQVFRFKRASRDEMMNRLKFILKKEKREIDEETLKFIIDRTDGCYRDAESLLGQLLTLGDKKVNQKDLQEFMGLPPVTVLEKFLEGMTVGESAKALAAVEEAFQGGYDPEQFLKESIRLARDEAVREVSEGESESERWPQVIRALLQALQDLAYVPQPTIALQLAVLSVCNVKGQERAKAQREQGTVSANRDKVTAVWPELIEEVKKSNPVAATFLRAVQPTVGSDGVVTMRAQYALHQTFFDKPDSKKLISSALSKLLKQEVRVVCVLDEDGARREPSMAERRRRHEDKFQQTVKEVFG